MELGAAGCALGGGILAAAAGPLVTFGVLGVLFGLGIFAAAAYRPVFATYAYLGTLPIVAGIDRGNLIPLVRPNEALLAVLLAGAIFGGYLRYCRGETVPFRLHRLDVPLAGFVLLSTVWPLASLMLRGQLPLITEVVAVLPICKLLAIYLLVRFTIATEPQLVRCFRLIVWPGAVVAVIAILQTLQFGPVLAMLAAGWSPEAEAGELASRGSTTLASPIATGDYIIICLVLVLCCGARGLLERRERLVLGLVLGTGVLAAGQFSTWISAAVAGALILWRFPELRRQAKRFLWVIPIAFVVGAPAFIGRLEGFADLGVPISWLGRWDNLSNFYIPEFGLVNVLVGVSPDPVLDAPETWREVIYLEAGYLQFLWIGGLPLLIAFGWLSVAVLRRARELTGSPGAVGATASALEICWWFLLVLTVLDPHLTMRGTGDLLFTMLAITTGALCGGRDQIERDPIVPYPGTGESPAPRSPGRWEYPARRAIDVTFATLALLVLAVPMLLVAAAIRFTSRGPALFRQQRIGLGSQPFTMYKFRTMRPGGDDAQLRDLIARELRGEDTSVDGSTKIDSDPRVTVLGSWLRRTSLDELPQLLNVLRGQMALVGPRPCLDWEAEMFPPEFTERFSVRPGLTGLWQVSGRSTMGTLDMLHLDRAYARGWGFWGDLRILARTVPTMLRGHGAR